MFGRPRSRSPHRGGNMTRQGDWFCPQCGDHQFAKNQICRQCGGPRPDDTSLAGPPDAATFLKDHIIDNDVLSRFLALESEQQDIVIRRGSLAGARDPSAVLSSRIQQVISGVTVGGMGGARSAPQVAADPMQQMQQMMMQMMGMLQGGAGGGMGGAGGGMAAPAMGGAKGNSQAMRQGDWFCSQCGDHQFSKNVLCRNCGSPRPTDGTDTQPPDVETFLAVHQGSLEDHAVQTFRALAPAQQEAVIRRGSLNGSRDPNAVLMTRCKEVRQNHAMGPGLGGNGIQPSATDWYCPNCYDLQFKNNDVCRICGTSRDLGVKDISMLDPATFLAGHQIEPHAVEQFLVLSDEAKRAVMSAGSLHGARDPTAVLINRISRSRGVGGGGAGGKGMGKMGKATDWYCNQCGDLQFARNVQCRNCGAAKPTDGSEYTPPDPITFLAMHQVEDHAKEKFLQLSLADQDKIIRKGSLAGSRDATAVLMTRIRQIATEGGGAPAATGGMGGMNNMMQDMMKQMMMQMMQQAQQ